MLKHTQTISQQQPTNSLSVFKHFMRLALNGLNYDDMIIETVTKYSTWVNHRNEETRTQKPLIPKWKHNCFGYTYLAVPVIRDAVN